MVRLSHSLHVAILMQALLVGQSCSTAATPTVARTNAEAQEAPRSAPEPLGHPSCEGTMLRNPTYVVCMRRAGQIAHWASYEITPERLNGEAERTDDFREDPRLPQANRTQLNDYRGSGFDRGHLIPAALFRSTVAAMSSSFLLTNVVPQAPRLNRGSWRKLESAVRKKARRSKSAWVLTGTLGERGRIGDGVIVPAQLWKALLYSNASGYVTIGALADNTEDGVVSVVSVDELERRTGLDLFAALPDPTETRIEAEVVTLLGGRETARGRSWPLSFRHESEPAPPLPAKLRAHVETANGAENRSAKPERGSLRARGRGALRSRDAGDRTRRHIATRVAPGTSPRAPERR